MKEKITGFFLTVGFVFSAICIIYTLQSFVEKKATGLLIWGNIILCDDSGTCFHELGHMKNEQMDYPSQSIEFKEAIDSFLAWCENGKEFWPTECEHLETFPGINGNELIDGKWGGYEELYCSLFEKYTWDNLFLPEYVRIFFDSYGWKVYGK